jgi:hypothetical protein
MQRLDIPRAPCGFKHLIHRTLSPGVPDFLICKNLRDYGCAALSIRVLPSGFALYFQQNYSDSCNPGRSKPAARIVVEAQGRRVGYRFDCANGTTAWRTGLTVIKHAVDERTGVYFEHIRRVCADHGRDWSSFARKTQQVFQEDARAFKYSPEFQQDLQAVFG